MIKNENYIVIQGFMRNELGLKGNDLLVYAIIYGFTQAESQRFTGSLGYLADWCGATKAGVIKNLKNLLDRGLIERTDRYTNGVKSVEYYATELNVVLNTVEQGVLNKVEYPIKQSLTNNIDDIKGYNKKDDIKHTYGEYKHVRLTDKERDRLMDDYGEVEALRAITYLDEYIEMKGYKAKSHYLALRKWVFDAVKRANKEENRYDYIKSSLCR